MKNQRHQKGKKDGTARSAPSPERPPVVETQPASSDNCSWRTEEAPPTKAEILDEFQWSIPSLTSHFESLGFDAELAARAAMFHMEEAKNWALRLEKDFHFEKLEGFCGVDYHILFYRGRNILVSADDVARATTYGAGSESQIGYSAAEIIETLDARDVVEVPGPEIPKNLPGEVEGTYIPIELALAILAHSENFARREMGADATKFSNLIDEFSDKQELLQEVRLRENRLRKARLVKANTKIYLLWLRVREERRKSKARDAKLRKAKLRSEKQKP